jgi:hypothetical protein
MTFAVILGDVAAFVGGGAFIWFFKERIQGLVIGANALSAKLRAKADAISAAAKKL